MEQTGWLAEHTDLRPVSRRVHMGWKEPLAEHTDCSLQQSGQGHLELKTRMCSEAPVVGAGTREAVAGRNLAAVELQVDCPLVLDEQQAALVPSWWPA